MNQIYLKEKKKKIIKKKTLWKKNQKTHLLNNPFVFCKRHLYCYFFPNLIYVSLQFSYHVICYDCNFHVLNNLLWNLLKKNVPVLFVVINSIFSVLQTLNGILILNVMVKFQLFYFHVKLNDLLNHLVYGILYDYNVLKMLIKLFFLGFDCWVRVLGTRVTSMVCMGEKWIVASEHCLLETVRELTWI